MRACGSDGTTVACYSGGATKELMSNEPRLLDFLAAARNSNGNLQRKTIAKCVRQHKCGLLEAVGHCELWSIVPRWRRKTSYTRWESMMSFRDPMLRRKDAVSFAPGGSQSTRGPMTLLSYVLGGLPRSSVVVAGTNTSTFSDTPDLALVKAVIAHAARRAESEDIVVAVFDVRRSYVYAEEKERHLC